MAYDQQLAGRIRAKLEGTPGVAEKQMFGGLAFLVRGHMAVAASGQGGLLVRCDPEQSVDVLASSKATLMEMRGKAMPGWLRVDAEAVAADSELAKWIDVGTN